MKAIIGTSRNYNGLNILKSVTYYYEDGSSKTEEVGERAKQDKEFKQTERSKAAYKKLIDSL